MTKPRTVTAVVNAILSADPRAHVQILCGKIVMQTFSAKAYVELKEDVDLPIISCSLSPGSSSARPTGQILWDRSPIPDPEEGRVKPYALKDSEAQKRYEETKEQEEDGAELIGGRRHPGSGAIDDLKSDASSRIWQEESKQTLAASFSLSLEVLNKIQVEAQRQKKKPIVHLRFKKIPDHMVVKEDWVVVQADVFGKMVELCGWKG